MEEPEYYGKDGNVELVEEVRRHKKKDRVMDINENVIMCVV